MAGGVAASFPGRLTVVPSRRAPLATAFAVLAFYLLLIPRTTLWDRDEPRFAQAAVEMVRSGNYLYPTFGGEVRAQKPILIYWLMALSIGALGATEVGARFWAPIGIGVTAWATYVIGRRLLSARVGLLAMLVVALNPLAMVEGTAATADAVLLALITCAMAAFTWRLTSTAVLAPSALFAVSVAGALLAKGPVGLLPLLVVAGTLWHLRTRSDARAIALELGVAAAVGGALFALWAIAANTASDGRFYMQGVEHDIVGRVLSPLEGHGGNPLLWLPFYPAVLVIGLAPWSAYVPAALHALWRRDRAQSDADRMLTWWIAGPFVAFSLAATHLPHYILPAWPALALAVASIVDGAGNGQADARARRWLARGVPLAIVTAVLAVAALIATPFLVDARTLLWRSAPVVVAIAATAILFVRAIQQEDHTRAPAVCLIAAILFQASMGFWWLPGLEQVKPVPRIAAVIGARAHAGEPVAAFGFGEPSFDFYLGRTPSRLATPAAVLSWSEVRQPGLLVTTRAALAQVGQSPSLHEIGSSAGINVASGRRLELVALERRVP